MKIGILGGGLTGLTIASNLKYDCEVLEKNKECGGLCRSLKEKGFTFDFGGAHIIYSKNQEIIKYIKKVLGKNCRQGRRNNKIYFKGRFVKYPFENGLSDLSPEDNFECLYYYLNNKYKKPSNFGEWLYYTFGKGIAEKYLIPYNQKIWKYPSEKMSFHWVERVPKPPIKDVIKSAVGISTEGYTHQLYFYYPKQGGIQSLIKAFEKRSPEISRNFKIKKIKREKRKWIVFSQNGEKKYDKLISTIPIFDLVFYLEKVPQKIKIALKGLKYNSLITVMIGLNQKELPDFTAVYFPQPELLFHRIAFPKNFSQNNVPKGKSSVIAEITSKPGDKIWKMSDKKIADHVIQDLHKLKIINKNKVFYQKVMRSKYAYVIYDRDYLKNIKIIKNYIKKIGIEPCGRFAEFEYLNMDACIERGLNLAKKING